MNLDCIASGLLVLIGGIFTITAIIFYIFPPKKINYLYGYRTTSSMKSEERWHFAQRFSAIAMLQSGLGMLLFSGLVWLSPFAETYNMVFAWVVLIGAFAFMFIRTEKAIKKRFPI